MFLHIYYEQCLRIKYAYEYEDMMDNRSDAVLVKCQILLKFGSQVNCARALGIDELRLSRIIHGRTKGTSEEVQALAQALDLPECHFERKLQGSPK